MTNEPTVKTVDAKKRKEQVDSAIAEYLASTYKAEKAKVTAVKEAASKLHKSQPAMEEASHCYQYPIAGYGTVNHAIANCKVGDEVEAIVVPVQKYYGTSEEILQTNIASDRVSSAKSLTLAVSQLCEVEGLDHKKVANLLNDSFNIVRNSEVRPASEETKATRATLKDKYEQANAKLESYKAVMVATLVEELGITEVAASALVESKLEKAS
jgi:hypothetical protein